MPAGFFKLSVSESSTPALVSLKMLTGVVINSWPSTPKASAEGAMTPLVLPLMPSVPALFAPMLNQDSTLNSPANPAARGSVIVLYATGCPASLNAANATLSIGGYQAQITYAGPAPGYPGLEQINAQIPTGFLPPGNQPVQLTVSGASSQPGINVSLR